MKPFIYALSACLSLTQFAHAAVNADDLLPPEQAFVPTVTASDKGVDVQFKIADGYYMYQSKITADTQPEKLLREPATFSQGEQKEDAALSRLRGSGRVLSACGHGIKHQRLRRVCA